MRTPAFVITLLLGSMVAPAVAIPPVAPPGALDAARRIAAWLESARLETGDGAAWPADPRDPTSVSRDLYHGTPGVILFLLELHRVTGDTRHLDAARRGADDLVAWLQEHGPEAECGLWTGLAGQGWTLDRVAEATGEARYRDAARRCMHLLLARAAAIGEGARWNDSTDLIGGSAGVGLYLLGAAERHDLEAALLMAERAGRHLVDVAITVPTGSGRPGKKWFMTPEYPRLMPNLSHGTAGVALFLVALHEALAGRDGADVDRRYLDAALAGARYLQSVADTGGDGCRVFHHEPDGEDLFYLGWCHGPVGTAQLFARLADVTGDDEHRRWEQRCARAVRTSGIPEQRTPGFWNNVGRCCGSAGVASFFLARHARDGDAADLAFARRVIDDLLARAAAVELADGGRGLEWVQAEHRVRPELLVAQTGYAQGAAGIGLTLLQLDAIERGRPAPRWLPDLAP